MISVYSSELHWFYVEATETIYPISYLVFFFLWCNSRTPASLLRFLDHRHTPLCVTPLDGWSSRRRDNSQHSKDTENHMLCEIRIRYPSRRAAADSRFRLRVHQDRPVALYRMAHEKLARRLVDQRGRRSRTLYRKLKKYKCKVLTGQRRCWKWSPWTSMHFCARCSILSYTRCNSAVSILWISVRIFSFRSSTKNRPVSNRLLRVCIQGVPEGMWNISGECSLC